MGVVENARQTHPHAYILRKRGFSMVFENGRGFDLEPFALG